MVIIAETKEGAIVIRYEVDAGGFDLSRRIWFEWLADGVRVDDKWWTGDFQDRLQRMTYRMSGLRNNPDREPVQKDARYLQLLELEQAGKKLSIRVIGYKE